MAFDIIIPVRCATHDDAFEPYPPREGCDDVVIAPVRARRRKLVVDRNAIDPRSSRVVRKWRHDMGRLWRRGSKVARRDLLFASDDEVGAIKRRVRRVARLASKTLAPESSLERERVRREIELVLMLQRFAIGVVEASRIMRRDRTTVGRAVRRGRAALRRVGKLRERRRVGESA